MLNSTYLILFHFIIKIIIFKNEPMNQLIHSLDKSQKYFFVFLLNHQHKTWRFVFYDKSGRQTFNIMAITVIK